MADQVTVDNGDGTDYVVSTDDAGASGQVQRVKIAYSADGSATHSTVDADGVLVNLGANNDVTVTSGTVTANIAAGTNNIGDVDVLTLPALVAGTANIGDVDVLTVPAPLSTTGGGTEAAALRVTVASNSTGVLAVTDNGGTLSIDDGAGSITVDGTVTVTDGSGSLTVDGTVAATQSGTWTVQPGNTANTTAWKVDGSAVTQPVSDGSGSLTVDAPVGTPAFVRLSDGSSAITTLPVSVASVPSHAVTNAGVFATQVDGAALTALQLIDDPVIVDDAAFTPATSKVMMAGFQADETATDSVDEGDAGAARMTLDRKTIVTVQPHAAGGCSIYRSIDLDEGTLEIVKNTAGTLYGMWVTNTATTTRFIKFYDAASGTAGTGTPVITIGIPGNSSDDVGGAFGPGGVGIAFATGICFGAVTGVADNDTGAPGTNDVIANVFYK